MFVNVDAKIQKTFVYCRVGLGRAFVVDAKKPAADQQLPAGYDSFYLKQAASEDKKDGTHLYLIKQQNQLLPLYVATFEFDPVEEKRSRERPMCDNCEKCIADVFCSADGAYLCKDCDVNLHCSKIAQRHQRSQLGRGPDAFGSCRIHQQSIEYFCSSCHVPVCIHCKMIGHHSSGEASKHKLVKVMDAFEVVLKESSKHDPSFEQRLAAIQKQMKSLGARKQQVDNMQTTLESQLEKMYHQALAELRKASERKRTILIGDELELHRQQDELKQLESFLEYQRTAVDMYHLLFNWSTHQAMRQSLREFAFFRENIDVALDLKIDGEVKICEQKCNDDVCITAHKQGQQQQGAGQNGGRYFSTAGSVKKAANATAIDLGKLQLKRTSDLFAEVLSGDASHERASIVNRYDMDERSATGTGYDDDYCC